MYRPEFFTLEELVHPNIVKSVHPDLCWKLLDPNILIVADEIRRSYGPTVVNDWSWGGGLRGAGLRALDGGFGSIRSMHMCGQALDFHFSKITIHEVYADIMKNHDKWYELGVRRIENPVHTDSVHGGWLHIDTKEQNKGEIYTFNP